MRTCLLCPGSSMSDEARHLHELQPGERFRFEGGEEVFTVEAVGITQCTYVPERKTARPVRKFKTGDGEEVEFRAGRRSSSKPCAPGATVIPV